jgi:hypothetical protein
MIGAFFIATTDRLSRLAHEYRPFAGLASQP